MALGRDSPWSRSIDLCISGPLFCTAQMLLLLLSIVRPPLAAQCVCACSRECVWFFQYMNARLRRQRRHQQRRRHDDHDERRDDNDNDMLATALPLRRQAALQAGPVCVPVRSHQPAASICACVRALVKPRVAELGRVRSVRKCARANSLVRPTTRPLRTLSGWRQLRRS